ncbi:MAG: penicillin-binding transpeptidase domain-containing protein [Clostridium sp.]|uniref:penicillin-binding transpeptidase domain-containing protein n=1 Tax=Clostridium sp. TaxID=1506 RepID=UPI003D6D25D5
MSKKTLRAILFVALGIILIVIAVFTYIFFTKGDSATQTFNTYKNNWVKKDYKSMYDMLSVKTKGEVTQKEFIDKYTNIYNGIEAKNISIKMENEDQIKEANKKDITIPFSLAMDTVAGQVTTPGYQAYMVKEKVDNKNQWTIGWDEKMIFPSMEAGDTVRVTTILATRGEISDRNGVALAKNTDDEIVTLGLEPIRFVKDKDTKIAQMAKILDINASVIVNKLKGNEASTQFIPIINILRSETAKIDGVMKIEGVLPQISKGRIYPGGEAFGSLIGYIRPITAEELENNSGKGYSAHSMIGAKGLEQVDEDRLKGENGSTIYISKVKDKSTVEIIKKQAKAGENIKLSVDIELQKKIYAEMKGEPGASTAVNPKTGEVLAMVSSPSFDSNAYSTYKSNKQLAAWKAADEPFKNRFSAAYSPGSTFKLITAAIGLDTGKIKPDEAIDIQGDTWQPDKSWGSHMVKRVNGDVSPVNLKNAFVYSDNIYFARSAISIGADAFISGSNKFGLGEKLPVGYPIRNSQVANNNKIKNDELLADTGYGQGEVLMSPLQLALSYSAVVNDGNIMSPTLEAVSEKILPVVWKQNVISKDNIKIIKDDLTAVIEDVNGTAHNVKIDGLALAGKTGTAELKKDDSDTTAEDNGWFVCMDTANPKIVVSMLIENVKNKGESHYVTPMVKGVMDYYLNRQTK